MMTKTAYYMQMAQEAAAQITGSTEQWTAFLTTSARLYKYPFAEQLMIYKQRPEATACAEYDLWNDRMNRYVKRGSKGIALLDMRGEQPKLRYVFDVADTGERKNSRPVQLWKMNAEHEQPIIRALDAAFDVPAGAGSLENHIMEAAERLARDYWEENRRQISDIVADSYLEGYDEINIGASFKRAAAVSIAYSVFTRTVGNADDYFEHEDFLDIFDFNTQAAANVLGTAVSEMSSQIFRKIERTIRTYERDKQAERSQNYDGAELHEERRLPDSGHPVVGAGTEAPGQVRENAQSVPAGEQHAAVQSPDPDRETVPTPVGDSGDRDRTNGADDGGASESESGTGQEIEPDGLGTAHEHVESAGRGSYSDGTYQQLNFMSLFQSEAEQIQKIDAAAENAAREAESEKPSAFVISEDEIDRMLRTGSNFEGGKIRIYALYQQQGDAKERAAFLKAEYGIGGHSYTFMDGSRGFADYDGKGILLRNYGHDREARLTWSAVDKRLDRLVENGQYLTALEMEEYRKLEQEYGAPLPMPTAAHVFPPTPPERYDTGNEHVDNMLNTVADVYARSELAAPQRFTVMETDDGYAVWDDIQDGIHVEPDGVSEEFTSEWEAETYRQQLIEKVQEREAKDWLYVEQSKQNLQQDIPFPDVESEEAPESAHAETDPLVLEMQEHARELARESGYAPDERFVVTMTGENFLDSKDAFTIWDYVKEEYYGYSDGKVQTFADYVSASEALQEIRGRNMEAEKEPATVQPEPAAPVQPDYRVGDTLYLDGKAFTIEKVGLFDVELRDPDSVYPIFRSESKENLARLLEHEENVHLHNLVVDLNPGREKQSEEQKSVIPETEPENTHAENYRINSFHLGEGSPKQKFRANMDAIYTLKTLENQHRDATPEEQETLANYVGWGGLADAFDAEKAAWTGEYKELKAALTEEEYAAARASTLNAHYTSPTVIRAIYEALDGMGFEKGNKDGKQPALRGKGHTRFARFRSLGKGYSIEELCEVIAGNAVHKSKFAEKTRTSARSAQVHQKAELSFLIDVRAKMQAGKGAGYARWAKVFNLKQMAKAMMFMEEHGIKSYAELKEKANGISEKCDALLESVKADEARMSEVSVLRKHLINYAKTKDVFAAYKASGYNPEFYEAHRDMLALRSAAKKAFDAYKKENGSDKKLPRISELNAEYAMLLERKKSSYAEYRKTKSEMQDWLVAQKIVQEILKEDEQKKEQLYEQEVRQEEENRQSS